VVGKVTAHLVVNTFCNGMENLDALPNVLQTDQEIETEASQRQDSGRPASHNRRGGEIVRRFARPDTFWQPSLENRYGAGGRRLPDPQNDEFILGGDWGDAGPRPFVNHPGDKQDRKTNGGKSSVCSNDYEIACGATGGLRHEPIRDADGGRVMRLLAIAITCFACLVAIVAIDACILLALEFVIRLARHG
jgi:hypothetical protein